MKEYGKRVTKTTRTKAGKADLSDYKAKATPKAWASKKATSLDSWTKKNAPKKPAKATKAKKVTAKKKAAR
ncbi:MAG: hypothetical protein QM765_24495 [Myxococcales bacterium]